MAPYQFLAALGLLICLKYASSTSVKPASQGDVTQLIYGSQSSLYLLNVTYVHASASSNNNSASFSLNTGRPTLLFSGLHDASSVDFLYGNGLVYWTDASRERIRMVSLLDSQSKSSTRISRTPNVLENLARGGNQANRGQSQRGQKGPQTPVSPKNVIRFGNGTIAGFRGPHSGDISEIGGGSNRGGDKIFSGAPKDVVRVGLLRPDGLALDWVTRKIYWVDSERGRIEVAGLDGSNRRVLFHRNVDQPKAVVLDPQHGYMYWTDWGEGARIERGGMNGGSTTRSILIHDDIKWPNTLTIDPLEGRIYWSDSKLGYIDSAKLDGSDRIRILRDPQFLPSSLAVDRLSVFWTDWHKQAIFSCEKEATEVGFDSVKVVIGQLQSPTGLHVFVPKSQLTDMEMPCSTDNGGCSHLCLLSPLAPFYQCSCPTGLPLLQDNKTCATSPGDMLLLVRRSDIRVISLVGDDQFIDMVLDLPDIKHAVMIDYDPVNKKIYWTDDKARTISRANINGTDVEKVVSSGLGSPEGVAVDYIAGNLYWSDSASNLIEVSRLDGSYRTVVISDGLDEPRAIVLDPINGRMYWTDWGTNAYIEGANLDGSGRVKIVETDIVWPNGLTMDREAGVLYWTDSKLDTIESVHVDGTNRRMKVMEEIPHVFGLALHGDYIYWTDWQQRRVERVLKGAEVGTVGGGGREIVIENLSDLMGISAISSSDNQGENECSRDNGGCSHLCLYRPPPLGASCACPFPLHLAPGNNKTCTTLGAFIVYSQRDSVHQMSLADSRNDVTLSLLGLESVTAIDFHYADDRLYWADKKTKSITRSYMNGTGHQVVVNGAGGIVDLAVDWLAGNLYWTDGASDQIIMSRMDGSSQKIIVWEDVKPRDIVVDPIRGYLIWINTQPVQARIERSAMDGSRRKTLIAFSDVQITSLTIDSASRTIFWTSVESKNGQGRIESCDFDGKVRRLVFENIGDSPMGIALFEKHVYWLDKTAKVALSASLENGGDRKVVKTEIGGVTDLFIYHAVKQSGWNLCSADNGTCKNLCIAGVRDVSDRADVVATSEFTRRCACPTHYELVKDGTSKDGTSCKEPSWYLLISKRTDISQLSLGSDIGGPQGGRRAPITPGPDTILSLSSSIISVVRAMDYSPLDDLIFWIDRSRHMWSSRRNGSEITQLINNTHPQLEGAQIEWAPSPFDLKINAVERIIYWSDSSLNVISVIRFDGTQVGTIIQDSQQKPRYLALAISRGLIFWSNVGRVPSIERAEIDGTSRQTLFNINIGRPGSLAVDGDQLFWADLELHRIETSDINGYNRRPLIGSVSESISLITHRGWLFWIDKEPKAVMGLQHDRSQMQPVTIRRMETPVMCLAVVAQPETGCTLGCSHLCVRSSDGTTRCSCPHGYQISEADGKTCEMVTHCDEKSFQCGAGVGGVNVKVTKRGGRRYAGQQTVCISLQWRCDGQADCPDHSDERNCSTICRSASGHNYFRCHNGKCSALEERCDGVSNCEDGSDEEGCHSCFSGLPKNSTEKCSHGGCFSADQKCDGKINCANSLDEAHCLPFGFETGVTKFKPEENGTSRIMILSFIGGSVCLLFPIVILFLCYKDRLPRRCGRIFCSPAKQKKGFCKAVNVESSSASSQPGSITSSLQVSLLPSTSSIISSASLPLEHLALSQAEHLALSQNERLALCPDERLAQCRDSYCTDDSQYPIYPHEPLNPPPTPVASDRSPIRSPSFCSDLTSLYSDYRLGARHYPTPCSTEVGYGGDSLAPSVIQLSSDYGGYETEPLNPPPPPTPYELSSDDRSSFAGTIVPNSSQRELVCKNRSKFPRRSRRMRKNGQRQDLYRQ